MTKTKNTRGVAGPRGSSLQEPTQREEPLPSHLKYTEEVEAWSLRHALATKMKTSSLSSWKSALGAPGERAKIPGSRTTASSKWYLEISPFLSV